MKRRARYLLFGISAAVFAALYLAGLRGLPPFGRYPGPYGDVINAIGVPERHITDMVTAVNFDFRGFDTLGEEFIMFTSVVGALVLLRRLRDENQARHEDQAPERQVPQPSDATRSFTLGLVGLVVLFGIYIVVHGQLTPGGGFQGGVILATAPLMVYLAGSFDQFRKITSHELVEVAEAIGAGGYAVIGAAALAVGAAFLQNFLPQGSLGSVVSGGTVALIDISVGLEVAAGFVLLLSAFLEEALTHELRGRG